MSNKIVEMKPIVPLKTINELNELIQRLVNQDFSYPEPEEKIIEKSKKIIDEIREHHRIRMINETSKRDAYNKTLSGQS